MCCVFNKHEMSMFTEIWITSSWILSRRITLRASVSISSSYLYSRYCHAQRFFDKFIFAIIAWMFCRNHHNVLQCIWKTFDKRFLTFVSNSQSLLWFFQFHYVVVNQIVNFKMNLWNSCPTSLGSCEVRCEWSLHHLV